mmetsp:Transcript_35916/g.101112  ORF Transcript_35916/g.101112 Transcript_35916/m.101112 type:complete len:280 (+) Transcript_35916:1241-2080(+)
MRLWSHVAIEEYNDVACRRVASLFLGPDEAHRLVVPEYSDLVPLLDALRQVHVLQWRLAAVVDDEDLAQQLRGGGVEHGLDRLHGILALLGARQHHRDRLRGPPEALRGGVELEAAPGRGGRPLPAGRVGGVRPERAGPRGARDVGRVEARRVGDRHGAVKDAGVGHVEARRIGGRQGAIVAQGCLLQLLQVERVRRLRRRRRVHQQPPGLQKVQPEQPQREEPQEPAPPSLALALADEGAELVEQRELKGREDGGEHGDDGQAVQGGAHEERGRRYDP